jgi:uncharacterized cupin superfamily protein
VGHTVGSLDELGEGYGFRKIRRALGVEAFGVNAIVMPPGYEGVEHYHELQDELYFVHQGTARVEVEGQVHELRPRWALPRRVDDAAEVLERGRRRLVMLVVGGKGGYVERTATWSTSPTYSAGRRSREEEDRRERLDDGLPADAADDPSPGGDVLPRQGDRHPPPGQELPPLHLRRLRPPLPAARRRAAGTRPRAR